MKTLTKLVLAAGAGYALRAYVKKDAILTNDALKNSVDRRISIEDMTWPRRPTFMEHQADFFGQKFAHWLFGDVSKNQSSASYDDPNATFFTDNPTRDPKNYYGGTLYNRFGRKGKN